MTHLWTRVAVAMMLVLLAPLLIIRAQSYDDHELRAVLMPDGCEMPCFLGIQPGITTVYEAVNLLEASGWVDRVNVQRNIAGWIEQVHWRWNGQQPAIFSSTSNNRIETERTVQTGTQRVVSFTIGTTIPVAYAYLLLGDTQRADSGKGGRQFGSLVSSFYLEPFVSIWSVVECPGTQERFWRSPMTIDFMSSDELSGRFNSIGYYCYVSGQNRG